MANCCFIVLVFVFLKQVARHQLKCEQLYGNQDQHVKCGEAVLKQAQRHMDYQNAHLQQHQRLYCSSWPFDQKNPQITSSQHNSIVALRVRQRTKIIEKLYSDASDRADIASANLAEVSSSPQIIVEEDYTDGKNDVENKGNDSYIKKFSHPKIRCPKCENKDNVQHITVKELTRLRILFVKQQILEKLRLKERPNVSAIGLPKPIYEGQTIQSEDDKSENKELDDYYARTQKKFVFLEKD